MRLAQVLANGVGSRRDSRRWTKYSNPFYPVQTPLPPKFSVNVTWNALAPMDEKNQTPNITFGNTRAETLRFGGAGVQHSARRRVWIFCPSTVSLSDVFTSFGLQTLLWKHHSACCWFYSKLRKTLAFHKYMPPVCLPSHFFYSLIRSLFLSAQNIVFSQVCATFVLPVPFFLFPNPQLIPNCKKHCVFTGKCCMCLSSHFFLFPNS